MITGKKIMLETIKDLQMDKAKELFDSMIASGSFVERKEIDHTVMFIFPDGRLLGSQDFDPKMSTKLGNNVSAYLGIRPAYHSEMTRYLPEEMKKKAHKDKWGIHPLSNDRIGKYYNIIIVAQGHISNQVLVPYLVEPTPQQLSRLQEFKSKGFNVEYAKQSYAGSSYSPIEEAFQPSSDEDISLYPEDQDLDIDHSKLYKDEYKIVYENRFVTVVKPLHPEYLKNITVQPFFYEYLDDVHVIFIKNDIRRMYFYGKICDRYPYNIYHESADKYLFPKGLIVEYDLLDSNLPGIEDLYNRGRVWLTWMK